MINILLVDDEPLILELYQERLAQQGAHVTTAADGMAAIQALRGSKPDVVVLDLMMPKFSGVDVLKFIRSTPELKTLPVVVLSNSYMNQLAAQAAALGVQKALLKVRCSPAILFEIINDILAGRTGTENPSHLLAVPERLPAAPSASDIISPGSPQAPAPSEAQPATEFYTKARRSFLQSAP